MKNLKRIWKNYNKWEDFKNGFYGTKQKVSDELIEDVRNLLTSEEFYNVAIKLFTEWKNSIDHNLSFIGSNRKSYLGQVVCCKVLGISAKTTSEAFTKMLKEDQVIANGIANRIIATYENNFYVNPSEVSNEGL